MRPENKLENGGRGQVVPRRGSAFSHSHGEPPRVMQGWDVAGLGSRTPLAAGRSSKEAGRPSGCHKGRRGESVFQWGWRSSLGRGSELKLRRRKHQNETGCAHEASARRAP